MGTNYAVNFLLFYFTVSRFSSLLRTENGDLYTSRDKMRRQNIVSSIWMGKNLTRRSWPTGNKLTNIPTEPVFHYFTLAMTPDDFTRQRKIPCPKKVKVNSEISFSGTNFTCVTCCKGYANLLLLSNNPAQDKHFCSWKVQLKKAL